MIALENEKAGAETGARLLFSVARNFRDARVREVGVTTELRTARTLTGHGPEDAEER